ncbi:hypothetical protein Slin15195_G126530 [Septoria linicola]|uniref:Uncharacterized protein n=1 Tax=Septoria linicola TaxID=215465 RepID=A0A9Q9B1N7_9PEZI|nr:hypothetical protein Slin15195_G126530 [Septoria linicola]
MSDMLREMARKRLRQQADESEDMSPSLPPPKKRSRRSINAADLATKTAPLFAVPKQMAMPLTKSQKNRLGLTNFGSPTGGPTPVGSPYGYANRVPTDDFIDFRESQQAQREYQRKHEQMSRKAVKAGKQKVTKQTEDVPAPQDFLIPDFPHFSGAFDPNVFSRIEEEQIGDACPRPLISSKASSGGFYSPLQAQDPLELTFLQTGATALEGAAQHQTITQNVVAPQHSMLQSRLGNVSLRRDSAVAPPLQFLQDDSLSSAPLHLPDFDFDTGYVDLDMQPLLLDFDLDATLGSLDALIQNIETSLETTSALQQINEYDANGDFRGIITPTAQLEDAAISSSQCQVDGEINGTQADESHGAIDDIFPALSPPCEEGDPRADSQHEIDEESPGTADYRLAHRQTDTNQGLD